MRKTFTFIAFAAAALLLSSCGKEDAPTVHERVPNKVSFQQRNLAGVTIGSALPADAEAIDLGLSVKWSNMNLGATSPEGFGELYAWGEIKPSGDYRWESYEMNDFNKNDEKTLYLNRYCFDKYGESQDLDKGGINLDRNDDAAYVLWGADWRMPTADEVKELSDKCKWSYTSKTKSFTVTGPNGNSITIAYSGYGIGKSIFSDAQGLADGGMWSSTLSASSSADAIKLMLAGQSGDKFSKGVYPNNRYIGCIIRPVSAK